MSSTEDLLSWYMHSKKPKMCSLHVVVWQKVASKCTRASVRTNVFHWTRKERDTLIVRQRKFIELFLFLYSTYRLLKDFTSTWHKLLQPSQEQLLLSNKVRLRGTGILACFLALMIWEAVSWPCFKLFYSNFGDAIKMKQIVTTQWKILGKKIPSPQ